MRTKSIDNLQQAITKAVAEVRNEYPVLSEEDVQSAYFRYQDHFKTREDDPPVSEKPAEDALLLCIWDVIVDRETEGLDEPGIPLEDYYVSVFAHLVAQEDELIFTEQPLALSHELAEPENQPAAVVEDTGEEGETPNPIDDEDSGTAETIYRLKISLDGSRPEIWRTLLVDREVTQNRLHHMIQAVMGWRGTEQFQFYPSVKNDLPSTGEILLKDLFVRVDDYCGYEFDSWYHDLILLATEQPEGRRHYPVCISGERACPPEDIGGVGEYNEMIKILDQPEHPDYTEMAGWLTQDFHPDAFNIEQANLRLARYQGDEFIAVV